MRDRGLGDRALLVGREPGTNSSSFAGQTTSAISLRRPARPRARRPRAPRGGSTGALRA